MVFNIRYYRTDDLDKIVAVINAADAFDTGEDGTTREELRLELSKLDLLPEENVFVAEDANGILVGYASLRLVQDPSLCSFRTWSVVHPSARNQGLETRLLERLYARAEERMGECVATTVDFSAFVNIHEHNSIQALEEFEMAEARRFWQMVRDLRDATPEPRLPRGIVTRAYRVNEDDAPMHAADTEAFRDHWGHVDHPLDHWLEYVRQPYFRPDLTVIGEDAVTREIAGFCAIVVNQDENMRIGKARGWIDLLGVRRSYRKNGLGTALILAGMRNLREAGLEQAALGCDSENPTGATRIYERVGFRVEKTRAAYRKFMRGSEEQLKQVESELIPVPA